MSSFIEHPTLLTSTQRFVTVADSTLTMMKGVSFLVAVTFMALASFLTSAFDPAPLQDLCVGINDPKEAVFVNGKFCKDPKLTVPDDFYHQGLHIPGNTQNLFGLNITFVTIQEFPGLNTLGLAMVRVDIAPFGVNPPHLHPRAAEIFTVLEGTLLAGFITSNPDHRLFSKILNKGDVFAFPFGLIHFQYNIGHTPAVAIAAFSSQWPGVITLANSTFGAHPSINPDALAKSFHLDRKVVEELQAFFE